ncbi:rRNA processing protein [Trypanosoma rangeli]|uniref:rRNA processing protein n=1 Tax=Trypanosoma rangeli TaxID=5698 RepID=A0A3R7KIH6_TRYRA|nr:rRNA processing protein [Trypanosoma rangeli]RNF07123.1 rRNA processing protein [Trypanosoma rangeli]|eukprot:RNF07123.1 rRNA processing protein [Trypanosoma rangeli]
MPVYDVAARKKRPAVVKPNITPKGVAAKTEAKSKAKVVFNNKNQTNTEDEKPAAVEFSEPAQWVERMALTSTKSLPADLNADDDPKREEVFIQQALLSVSRGLSLLEKADVPWKRPADYYAEMFKDDVQMSRIAAAIETFKTRIEAQAHRRAMKDQKKYGKEVQAEVLRQRAKYKRDMGERLTEWRRKRKGNEELRDILDDGDATGGGGSGGAAQRARTPKQKGLRPGGGGGAKKRPGKNARRRR